jgi:ATP-dependent helicase YprA (DUF1998 family)
MKRSGRVSNHQGEQYLTQYFNQKKNTNFIHLNNKYAQPPYHSKKFAQVESPKDSSIERARQEDII